MYTTSSANAQDNSIENNTSTELIPPDEANILFCQQFRYFGSI